jgi:hypothetical protein
MTGRLIVGSIGSVPPRREKKALKPSMPVAAFGLCWM